MYKITTTMTGTDQESGQTKLPYPKGGYFILAGYLLERFVYYGLFGGSVFYMQRMLGFTASSASTTKSILESLIYFAPILGAILADTYLGKVCISSILPSLYACVAFHLLIKRCRVLFYNFVNIILKVINNFENIM